jgi:hypothetical protein
MHRFVQTLPGTLAARPIIAVMRRTIRQAAPPRGSTLLVVLIAVATAPSPARAGTIRHDRDPQQYLNLGAAPEYASVGKFDLTKHEPGYAASGTLVDDKWVLTAAHAFDGTTSGSFTVGGKAYAVERWVTHPKWDGQLRRGYDLALVKLGAPVTDVAPATLYTARRELNSVATFVGFGRTGTGVSGHSEYDALKRAGQNTVDGTVGPEQWPANATFRDRLPRSARSFLVDFDDPTNPAESRTGGGPVDLEFLISLGDSGGGAFVNTPRGQQLAGVHSFAEIPDGSDNSDYGDITGHVRVSAHAKWIRNLLKRERKAELAAARREARLARLTRDSDGLARILSPELAGSASATGGAVPEPASLSLLALGAMLLRRPSRAVRV